MTKTKHTNAYTTATRRRIYHIKRQHDVVVQKKTRTHTHKRSQVVVVGTTKKRKKTYTHTHTTTSHKRILHIKRQPAMIVGIKKKHTRTHTQQQNRSAYNMSNDTMMRSLVHNEITKKQNTHTYTHTHAITTHTRRHHIKRLPEAVVETKTKKKQKKH